MKTPEYRDLDLPKHHLLPGNDYLIRRTRDPLEARRRRANPPHTTALEHQRIGLDVVRRFVEVTDNFYDRRAAGLIAAQALINSGAYSLLNTAPTQRSRIKLDVLATDANDEGDEDWRQTFTGLQAVADQRGITVENRASDVLEAHQAESPRTTAKRRAFGRDAIQLGLEIGFLTSYDKVMPGGSAADVQRFVRDHGLYLIGAAQRSHQEFGTHLTLAQFADPDSDAMTKLRRDGTDGIYRAIDQAHQEAA